MDEQDLEQYFGDTHPHGTGYVFFYTARDFNQASLIQSMMLPGSNRTRNANESEPPQEEEEKRPSWTRRFSPTSPPATLSDEKESWGWFGLKKPTMTK